MKIGAMMCAFCESRMIVPSIKQFDGIDIEDVFVAVSSKPWYGDNVRDDTAERAVRAGAVVKLFDWKQEHEQKNWILDRMQDFDWVLMFAPDMFMTKESLGKLTGFLRSDEATNRGYGCNMLTYWRDLDHVIRPSPLFASVAIRPKERFVFSSIFKDFDRFSPVNEVIMHHLSWYRTDEEVSTKIISYSHAPEIRGNEWYEKVWLAREENPVNFAPTVPEDYKSLEEYPLPDELRDLLKKYNALI